MARAMADLRIGSGDPEQQVGGLSGGNQQKVVVGKFLLTGARILLLYDLTRGVDVGTKAEIFRMMDDLAAQGYAILFYSSDLAEIENVPHRICVMFEGQIVADVPARISQPRRSGRGHGRRIGGAGLSRGQRRHRRPGGHDQQGHGGEPAMMPGTGTGTRTASRVGRPAGRAAAVADLRAYSVAADIRPAAAWALTLIFLFTYAAKQPGTLSGSSLGILAADTVALGHARPRPGNRHPDRRALICRSAVCWHLARRSRPLISPTARPRSSGASPSLLSAERPG